MLIRICLIIAIVAGLAVGTLNFVTVKEKITTLQTNLAIETEGRQKAENDLRKTRADLAKTTEDLKQTTAQLEETTAERDTAVAEADRRTKEAEKLAANLERTTNERNEAQDLVARYRAAGMEPEQVAAANARIKELMAYLEGTQKENQFLGQKMEKLQIALDRFINPEKKIALPAGLRGRILVSDPKWNFVVIDVGENQGVKEFGEMLVNRDGKLVGKVVVRNVQKDRSVANVMPGWDIGEVMEGDVVIPAYPAS